MCAAIGSAERWRALVPVDDERAVGEDRGS
jgi:hypothetical protein